MRVLFYHFLLVSTFMLSSFVSNAQKYFGYKGGVNLANVSTTEDGFITEERITGLSAHLFLDFTLINNFGLQPEMGFIQKGYRRTITLFGEKRYATKINYLDFSLNLKYRLGNKNLKGFLLAGPHFNFALSGNTKDLDEGSTNKVEIDEGGGINRTDLGITLGGGIGTSIRDGDLFLEIRYLHGLQTINVTAFDDGDLQNRGININVGYIFEIGR